MTRTLAIVGGGPAGLMAAETALAGGVRVELYDAMASVGRKFLLAGKGGLNLTHAEPFAAFAGRYRQHGGEREREVLRALLAAFDAGALRAWAGSLGVETFVGSSQRVFPRDMKAAPLLRAWVRRLRGAGAVFHTRHRWIGWDSASGAPARLRFLTGDGRARNASADALLLALGGGSWPRLGSDGAWPPWLRERGVEVYPLQPANCGFDCRWSEHFARRFAGAPVKAVAARIETTAAGDDNNSDSDSDSDSDDGNGRGNVSGGGNVRSGGGNTATAGDTAPAATTRRGEFIVTADGVEGSLIYALSGELRDALQRAGHAGAEAVLRLDLVPDRTLPELTERLARPRNGRSWSEHLRRQARIDGVRAGLLRELAPAQVFEAPARVAAALKGLRLPVSAPRPLAEAISSAGGVAFAALDERLMCRALPGVFCAGEMLDWEAPTGGYLLTACFASGRAAALGALDWLRQPARHDASRC